jgi:hypothetical protein
METRNFIISDTAARVLSFQLCSASTQSFSCTSYPVFSLSTTDGTSTYAVDTPLKQLSPPGPYVASNSPAVSFHGPSGTGTITFTYGSSFSVASEEWAASATPRMYRYFLHSSSYSPGTAYSAAITANANVVIGGSIGMLAVPVAPPTVATVCFIEVA